MAASLQVEKEAGRNSVRGTRRARFGQRERNTVGKREQVVPGTTTASNSLGFRYGSMSVHTSRTMMLHELQVLLEYVPAAAAEAAYTNAILDDNVLGKPTRTTRQKTAKRLRELYTLDPQVTLFRLLRHFWSTAPDSQPMLAFLVAAARDPLLRDTTPFMQETRIGQTISSSELSDALNEKYPERFKATTLRSTAQNLASSWTQAGFVKGRVKKERTRPTITPVVAAFALLLGYLCGLRGSLLMDCIWTRLLDCSRSELTDLSMEASKQGWLSFKLGGSVIEVTFPGLLMPAEEKVVNESH